MPAKYLLAGSISLWLALAAAPIECAECSPTPDID